MDFFALLGGLSGRIDRRTYAFVGFGLMLLKYLVDACVVHLATGVFWTPLDYLNPVFFLRQERLGNASPAFQLGLAVWTLPFLWIGVSMTMRRAHDAGRSAWWGLLFFVPVLNYLQMLWLCAAPSRPREEPPDEPAPPAIHESLSAALLAIPISITVGAIPLLFSIYVAQSYGLALFAATPFLLGFVGAFLYNRAEPRALAPTLGVVSLSVAMSGGALLLFAAEGVICILMAAPIVLSVALIGAIFGRAVARFGGQPAYPGFLSAVLVLPLLTGAEAKLDEPASFEVVTVVEVDAPPEQVWRHVVSFAELPEPHQMVFRLGIAYPLRARIDGAGVGAGVGAVRHCEFSTGAFVEPITRWDEPRTLSFDVVAQPPPMQEWSPYRNVHAPHLDGYLRSRRGELRLIPLPGRRTRLEGSMWYEPDIHPAGYWRLWSDLLIHRIHRRVLEHVKEPAEDF